MNRLAVLIATGVAAGSLQACADKFEAPYDKGVCFAVERGAEGERPTFNKVADAQPQIEYCAARLEEVRLRFLRLGGTRAEMTGSYQGQYIFIDRAGVWIGKSLDGPRFIALARTGDGRLAMPGAITRDATGRPVGVAAPADAPAAP